VLDALRQVREGLLRQVLEDGDLPEQDGLVQWRLPEGRSLPHRARADKAA